MKKMNKKLAAGLVIAAICAGCGFGGYKIYDYYHGGTVNVYSLDYISTEDYGSQSSTSGTVTTSNLQVEYISDTQTVEKIKVKEGQEVKKGDVLFTYDSTLTDIDLQRKKIDLQQKELDLEKATKELAVIRTYRAGVPVSDPIFTEDYTIEDFSEGDDSGDELYASLLSAEDDSDSLENLKPESGKGTKKKPYVYKWKDSYRFTDEFLSIITQGRDDCYVTFYLTGDEVEIPEIPETEETETPETESPETEEPETEAPETEETNAPETETEMPETEESETDASQGGAQTEDLLKAKPAARAAAKTEDKDYSAGWTMHIQHTVDGWRYVMTTISVGGIETKVSDPLPDMTEDEKIPETEETEETEEPDWGGGGGEYYEEGTTFTAAELAQMISQKEQEVKAKGIEYRQLALEVKKLDREMNNSEVCAAVDGTVITLNDPDNMEEGEPLIKVSGGGGYLVTGSLSELDLSDFSDGMMVDVMDYDTGNYYMAEVEEVSDYPTSYADYWGEGNSNVSYYNFTARIDDAADLESGAYVEISYNAESGSSSLYLMNAFVRKENGQSYIYVDEDGHLVKRYVKTGKSLYGYYTEIKDGGLSMDDMVAFPYGQNVREGAATTEGDIDSLYSY